MKLSSRAGERSVTLRLGQALRIICFQIDGTPSKEISRKGGEDTAENLTPKKEFLEPKMEMVFSSQEAKMRGQGIVGKVKSRNAIQTTTRGSLHPDPEKRLKCLNEQWRITANIH